VRPGTGPGVPGAGPGSPARMLAQGAPARSAPAAAQRRRRRQRAAQDVEKGKLAIID